jgi:hypothetical protein
MAPRSSFHGPRPSPGGGEAAAFGVRRTSEAGGGKAGPGEAGQALQATALIHDAYIRLVDVDKAQHWNGRGHFFGAAAEAMRRILVNHARDKATETRVADWG